MAGRIRRLGRLGLFVAMAGVSWLVEACGGTKDSHQPTGSGGSSTGGDGSSATGGTLTGGTGGSATGGAPTGGTGGEGGLHDLPCE